MTTTGQITTATLRARLEEITRSHEWVGVDTLLSRGSDSFDWVEMSVGALRDLLEHAFAAGLDAANQEGITTLVQVEGEEFTEADYQPLHVAPETLTAEEAMRVGTHGATNTWLPLGGGRHILIYTTWINATGWVKIPATYTANGTGFERTAWNPKGFDNNHMREEANAEALAWALAN